MFRSVASTADKALQSAIKAEHSECDEARNAFDSAIEKIDECCKEFPDWNLGDVMGEMERARENDEKFVRKRDRLIHKRREQGKGERPPAGKEVSVTIFMGMEALTKKPTKWIPSKIGSNLCLEAVLWVLKQKNYVTLSNNPYFYQDLPELPAKYDAEFNNKPLSFGKSVGDISLRDALYVLTDRAHHIYVKLEKGSRAFGNSWKPDKHIILKDVTGKLEAAKTVGETVGSQTLQLFTGEQKQKTSITNSNLEVLIEKALNIDDKVFIEPANEYSISDTSDSSTPTVTEQLYEGKDVDILDILAEEATIYKNKLNTKLLLDDPDLLSPTDTAVSPSSPDISPAINTSHEGPSSTPLDAEQIYSHLHPNPSPPLNPSISPDPSTPLDHSTPPTPLKPPEPLDPSTQSTGPATDTGHIDPSPTPPDPEQIYHPTRGDGSTTNPNTSIYNKHSKFLNPSSVLPPASTSYAQTTDIMATEDQEDISPPESALGVLSGLQLSKKKKKGWSWKPLKRFVQAAVQPIVNVIKKPQNKK